MRFIVSPFQASFRRQVIAHFDGGAINPDGGGLLLKPLEDRTGILRQFAACFVDATDNLLHGNQLGKFFHEYYREYCYLLLYIFCGEHLLCAKLRPADLDASTGSVKHLDRIVSRIRQAWPKVRILIRGDSGFCRETIMAWCERNGVDYLLGLAGNARLKREVVEALAQAKQQFDQTGQASRAFVELRYQTLDSWSRERRVVGKAEYLPGGENPRFVVTSISPEQIPAAVLYEQHYCARGDMENRIKEQQSIRLTVRKVWISLSESFPHRELFVQTGISQPSGLIGLERGHARPSGWKDPAPMMRRHTVCQDSDGPLQGAMELRQSDVRNVCDQALPVKPFRQFQTLLRRQTLERDAQDGVLVWV